MKKINFLGIPMEVYHTQNPNDLELVVETCLEYHNQQVRECDTYDNEIAEYTQEIKALINADTTLDKWNVLVNSSLFHDAVGELIDFEGRSPYNIFVATEY